MQLMGKGGPRIMESSVDSKKDLERQLKASCEAFIMAVTKVGEGEAMLPALTRGSVLESSLQACECHESCSNVIITHRVEARWILSEK